MLFLLGIRCEFTPLFFLYFWAGVTQVDYEMALEYAAQSGVSEEPPEAIYLQVLEGKYNFVEFHSPVCVFRLIQ